MLTKTHESKTQFFGAIFLTFTKNGTQKFEQQFFSANSTKCLNAQKSQRNTLKNTFPNNLNIMHTLKCIKLLMLYK